MEKYNIATSEGWRVLRFTTDQIKKAETYSQIKKCLEQKA
jgi:very-short-patch-repair endonuclease